MTIEYGYKRRFDLVRVDKEVNNSWDDDAYIAVSHAATNEGYTAIEVVRSGKNHLILLDKNEAIELLTVLFGHVQSLLEDDNESE